MRFISLFILFLTNLIEGSSEFYICSCGDVRFLGKYVIDKEIGGIPTYINDNGMSFFNNNNFWYLGSLDVWPPETYYRCVNKEGCNAHVNTPPVPGKWTVNKKHGKDPIPVVQTTPCTQDDEL